MIQKIKHIIEDIRVKNRKILAVTTENYWANVYHDSIRGRAWLQALPLNIGRWAGNYSFFYVLNRILTDYKPKTILEFGLGESSKFVNAFLKHELTQTTHTIIEHNAAWEQHFVTTTALTERSSIKICPIITEKIKAHDVNVYENVASSLNGEAFDLYIFDGPLGSPRYSRYDIVKLAKRFDKNHEFIMIIDDYNRHGEQETVKDLLQHFSNIGTKIYKGTYIGEKRVLVLATEKYKYIESL